MIKEQLSKDNQLLAELVIAKELHMTLVQLREAMTLEELWLWHAFLSLRQDEEAKALEKARRSSRRR